MIAANVPDCGGDIPQSVESRRTSTNAYDGTDSPSCVRRHHRPGPALLGGRHSRRHAAMPANSALIAVLILDRPLCVDCIATESAIARSEVERYLNAMAHSPLKPRRFENDRWRSCGEGRLVFSLHRSLTTGSA
jgi:hypothetical protein